MPPSSLRLNNTARGLLNSAVFKESGLSQADWQAWLDLRSTFVCLGRPSTRGGIEFQLAQALGDPREIIAHTISRTKYDEERARIPQVKAKLDEALVIINDRYSELRDVGARLAVFHDKRADEVSKAVHTIEFHDGFAGSGIHFCDTRGDIIPHQLHFIHTIDGFDGSQCIEPSVRDNFLASFGFDFSRAIQGSREIAIDKISEQHFLSAIYGLLQTLSLCRAAVARNEADLDRYNPTHMTTQKVVNLLGQGK